MNIFFHELKTNFRSLIIWGVIMVIFIFTGMTKFQAYVENPEMLEIIEAMPKAFLEAFSFNAFNLTTLEGFFGVMFTYFVLMVSIAAAMWGSNINSKEERDKTVEFSLTLPVKRSTIITAKIAAAVVNCLGLLGFVALGLYITVSQYNPSPEFFDFMYICLAALFVVEMIFLSVGILVGCALKQYRLAGSLAVGAILATYFLSIASGLHENLEFLKFATPFKYFDPATLMQDLSLDGGMLALSIGIIAVCLVLAYVTYQKRDLYI